MTSIGPLQHILDSYLKRSSSVLELGCGDGKLITAIAGSGYPLKRIVAVDFYNQPASLPSSVTFVKQDLEHFDVKGPFDLVILHHVLEHIKDPIGLIERVKKELSPNGRILIVVPNRRGWGNEARVYLPEHGKHYFLWDSESMEYTLNRLGFVVRFHNLRTPSTGHLLMRYAATLAGWKNPNLICVAMKDVAE